MIKELRKVIMKMSELENKYVRNKAKENINSAVNHTKREKKIL